jgi:hypothetical protein
MNLSKIAIGFIAGALASGCDVQAGPGYQGEPLFSIQGSVVNHAPTAVGYAEVMLGWAQRSDMTPIPGTTVPVLGEFPASFTIELFTPPPDQAILTWGPNAELMASAFINAFQTEEDGNVTYLGKVDMHTLIYLPEAVAADSLLGIRYGGGPLTPGYHLTHTTTWPTPEEISQCVSDLVSGGCSQAYADRICANTGDGEVRVVPPGTPLTIDIGLPGC